MLVITHYFTLVSKAFFWIRYVTCMTSYNAVPLCLLALATISTYDDDRQTALTSASFVNKCTSI